MENGGCSFFFFFFFPENLNPNFRQGGFRVGIMQFGLGTQNSKKSFKKIKKDLDLLAFILLLLFSTLDNKKVRVMVTDEAYFFFLSMENFHIFYAVCILFSALLVLIDKH